MWAALGKKVLVVDLDPQGNTTSGYGVAKHELESDIYTCLIDDEDVRAAIVKTKYNVSLLPSNTQLAGRRSNLSSCRGAKTACAACWRRSCRRMTISSSTARPRSTC